MTISKGKDQILLFLALVAGFIMAVAFSAWAATTLSTNVTTGGHVYATSTVQATGSLIGYGNLLAGGTTTATVTGFNLGGVAGTHRDAYISGGLGIGNATTTDGSLEVNVDTVIYDDAWVKSGLAVGTSATSTAGAIDTTGNVHIGGNLQVGNSGTAINQILHSGTCTVDPPSLSAGDLGHASCTDASGVAASDRVFHSLGMGAGWNSNVIITNASSTAADTINFVFKNTSTTTVIDVGSVSVPWFAIQ